MIRESFEQLSEISVSSDALLLMETEGDREGQGNTSQGNLIPICFDLEPQLATLRIGSHLEKTENRQPRQRKLDAISSGGVE